MEAVDSVVTGDADPSELLLTEPKGNETSGTVFMDTGLNSHDLDIIETGTVELPQQCSVYGRHAKTRIY